MQAEFDRPRTDAFAIVWVVWAAGILATIAILLLYVAVQSYNPDLSCDELHDKVGGGSVPRNVDAWNDYELLCGQPPLS